MLMIRIARHSHPLGWAVPLIDDTLVGRIPRPHQEVCLHHQQGNGGAHGLERGCTTYGIIHTDVNAIVRRAR